jgi:hypothetical protein
MRSVERSSTCRDAKCACDLSRFVSPPTPSYMSDEIEQPALTRPRRTTLETFNDEMAVLDRPLENDVEYFDEKPPAKARRFGTIAGAVLIVGAAATLLMSRGSGDAHATPPLAIVTAPAPAPAPVLAPVAPPPVALPPAQVAMNNDPPMAMPHASSRATWSKAAAPSRHDARKRKHHAR